MIVCPELNFNSDINKQAWTVKVGTRSKQWKTYAVDSGRKGFAASTTRVNCNSNVPSLKLLFCTAIFRQHGFFLSLKSSVMHFFVQRENFPVHCIKCGSIGFSWVWALWYKLCVRKAMRNRIPIRENDLLCNLVVTEGIVLNFYYVRMIPNAMPNALNVRDIYKGVSRAANRRQLNDSYISPHSKCLVWTINATQLRKFNLNLLLLHSEHPQLSYGWDHVSKGSWKKGAVWNWYVWWVGDSNFKLL